MSVISLPDDEGLAWIAFRGYGLVKMEPVVHVMEHLGTPWIGRDMKSNDEGNNIRSFIETETGYLVASLQGLFHYDASTLSSREVGELFGPGLLSTGALATDGSGNTWMGTWLGQVCIRNLKTNRHFAPAPIPPWTARVRYLFCDSKRTMWIATEGDGLYTVNTNEINFDDPSSLKFNHISHDDKKTSTISSNIVFALIEDADGNIWAGTDNGLNRYDPVSKKWTSLHQYAR
jgi:ligand-binding sensor domain-containing protein